MCPPPQGCPVRWPGCDDDGAAGLTAPRAADRCVLRAVWRVLGAVPSGQTQRCARREGPGPVLLPVSAACQRKVAVPCPTWLPSSRPPKVVTPGPRGPVPSRPTGNTFISVGSAPSTWQGPWLGLRLQCYKVRTSVCGVTHTTVVCHTPGCQEEKQDTDRILEAEDIGEGLRSIRMTGQGTLDSTLTPPTPRS